MNRHPARTLWIGPAIAVGVYAGPALWSASAGSAGPTRRDPVELFAAAVAAARSGDAQNAVRQIIEILNATPEEFSAAGTALAPLDQADLRQLRKAARARLRQEEPRGAALWLVAWLQTRTGQPNRAAELLAAEIEPRLKAGSLKRADGPACALLCEIWLKRFRWSDVAALVRAAADAGFQHASIQMSLAAALEARDEVSGALEAWRAAAALAPRDAQPRLRLAELQTREGDPSGAMQTYDAIVSECDPLCGPAYEALIRGFLAAGDLNHATERLRAAQRAGVTGPVVARMSALLDVMSAAGGAAQRADTYCRAVRAILRDAPDDIPTLLDLAYSEAGRSRPKDALRRVEHLLSLQPDHVAGRELKVDVLLTLLRQDEARRLLESMVQERPDYSRWRRRLAELAIDQVDDKAAIEHLRYLLSRPTLKEPQRLELTAQLLDVLEGSGQVEAALRLAREAYEADRADAARRMVHLTMLQRAGRHDDAIALARSWQREAPTRYEWQEPLALALVRGGHADEARLEIAGFMEDAPDDARLVNLLHRVLMMTHRTDEAIRLARAGGVAGAGVDAARLLDALTEAGPYDEAVALARQVEAARRGMRPGSLTADLAIRFDRLTDAERLLSASVDEDRRRRAAGQPVDVGDLIGRMQALAAVYQRTDRQSRAEQLLKEALELAPRDPGINNDLGYTWAEMEWNLDKAEEMIGLAVARFPREAAYLDSMGWVRYKQGDFASAAEWLRRAVRWRRQDPTLLDHYGDALWRLGRTDEAVKQWTAAADADAGEPRRRSAEAARAAEQARRKAAAAEAGQRPAVSPAPRAASRPASREGDD